MIFGSIPPSSIPLIVADNAHPIQTFVGGWDQIDNIDGLAVVSVIPIPGKIEFGEEFGVSLPIRMNHVDATQSPHT